MVLALDIEGVVVDIHKAPVVPLEDEHKAAWLAVEEGEAVVHMPPSGVGGEERRGKSMSRTSYYACNRPGRGMIVLVACLLQHFPVSV